VSGFGSQSTKGPVVGRRTRRRLAAGAVAVAAAVAAGSTLTGASAFEGPRGHHQWVQFVTKGAPTWSAEMWLYDSKGKEVYYWNVDSKVGGKETWWYTRQGGYLTVRLSAKDGSLGWKHRPNFHISPTDADGHCFLIDKWGEMRYTGHSETHGCTPD
jgi:hypothetical protein